MANRIRMARTVAAGLLQPKIPLLGESRVALRVALSDLDLNLHVTNSQYLKIMDLGRTDLLLRTGLAAAAWKLRANPVVGGAAIRYKAELRARTRFAIVSRFIGWDEKWFYCHQAFRVGERDYAVGVVKMLFHAGSHKFPPAELLEAHRDGPAPSPLDEPSIAAWATDNGL